MVYFNKAQFCGQWEKGKQNGKGKFIFPNGDCYDGTWENGKMHGLGIYENNGLRISGKWEYGNLIS